MEIPISRLAKGERFELVLETTGRRIAGTVLYHTSGSTAVRLDAQGVREFTRTNKKTGELDIVQVRNAAVIEHWSLGTPVERVAEKRADAMQKDAAAAP